MNIGRRHRAQAPNQIGFARPGQWRSNPDHILLESHYPVNGSGAFDSSLEGPRCHSVTLAMSKGQTAARIAPEESGRDCADVGESAIVASWQSLDLRCDSERLRRAFPWRARAARAVTRAVWSPASRPTFRQAMTSALVGISRLRGVHTLASTGRRFPSGLVVRWLYHQVPCWPEPVCVC